MQMKQGAVICLQEVSRKWGGELVPFFEEHGYTYAAALSGGSFGGYMGQCTAWPSGRFRAEKVESKRISDTVTWPKGFGKQPAVPAQSFSFWAWWFAPAKWLASVVGLGGGAGGGDGRRKRGPFNVWREAWSRHNCAVLACLVEKETGKRFVVGNYHMPCLFGTDEKVGRGGLGEAGKGRETNGEEGRGWVGG